MSLREDWPVIIICAITGLIIGAVAGYIAMYIDIPAGIWDEYNLTTLPVAVELRYYGWDWLWTTPLAAAVLGFVCVLFSGE